MNINSFKEQFPSIKEKTFEIDWTCQGITKIDYKTECYGEYILTENVIINCLDKQKVKESFDKVKELIKKYLNYYNELLKLENKSVGLKMLADLEEIEKEIRLLE